MAKYTVNLIYGKATFPLTKKKKKNIGYKVSVTYRVFLLNVYYYYK